MNMPTSRLPARFVVTIATATLVAACAAEAPLAPDRTPTQSMELARVEVADTRTEAARALATLRRATARYHDLTAATDDGFVFLHGCESRPDEGPVGMVYVHPGRLDAIIDPALPEALVYEPREDGSARPVGVELAVPYVAWTSAQPPEFVGASFQPEDEFGVWGRQRQWMRSI